MSTHAFIIVDMVKDNVNTGGHGMMDVEAVKIIPPIRDPAREFRKNLCRVVFACDGFIEGDFIFKARMPPHAIRGTGGNNPSILPILV